MSFQIGQITCTLLLFIVHCNNPPGTGLLDFPSPTCLHSLTAVPAMLCEPHMFRLQEL